MPEFAAVDNFQASEPETVVFNIPAVGASGPNGEVDIFVTSQPSLWRVRVVAIRGSVDGFAGTCNLSLAFNISGAAKMPWTNANNNSGPTLTSPQAISFGENFSYTWSTEVGDNYFGNNFQFGRVSVMGLPFMFLPGDTHIAIDMTNLGGFTGNLFISDGFMQIEKFPLSAVSGGGGDEFALYLQPVA